MQEKLNRIDELINIINKLSYEYYTLDNPSVSDLEYDRYIGELKDLETVVGYIREDSPTNKVGGVVLSEFKKVTHDIRMMSLDNAFNEEEVRDFDNKIKTVVQNPKYTCELKIDGLACSFKYINGIFTLGATRGDSITGEDITTNIKTIKTLPLSLKDKLDIEVRGEVFMSKAVLNSLNEERLEKGEPLFQNPRNAAAGSVRQLDSSIAAKRNLDAFIYHLPKASYYNIDSHYESILFMKKLGFKTNPNTKLCNNIDEVIEFINYYEENRDNLEYEIDGVVIKVDNIDDYEKIGVTNKFPKWAIAYKFKALEVVTKLTNITFTVGRTGQVTPNAIFEPVKLMGSTIRKSTLHNEENCVNKDIRINDYIVVRKAGDVIPEVVRSIKERRVGSEIPFKMVECCPICESKLYKDENKADYFCINPLCDAKKIEAMIHFSERDAMNIDGLGEKVVEEFYNLGFIKNILDIYKLKNRQEELEELYGFGKKSISNLIESIEKSKNISLERFLFGLGINQVGKKTSKLLSSKYQTIEDLKKATIEELSSIKDIGGIIANNIIEYFNNEENIRLINDLINEGLTLNNEIKTINDNIYFKDKTFVITGTFNIKRDEIIEIIESNGGKVTNSVSKKTDVVLCGTDSGSKKEKATELNIEIWDEDYFSEIMNNI